MIADFVIARMTDDLGPEGTRAVVDVFKRDAGQLIQRMTVAASTGDTESFRRAAHGLSGAAGAVGAAAVELTARHHMTCVRMEARTLIAAASELDRLSREAVAELDAIAANLPSPV